MGNISRVQFSPMAQRELSHLFYTHDQTKNWSSAILKNPASIEFLPQEMPHFCRDVEIFRSQVEDINPILLIEPMQELQDPFTQQRIVTWLLGQVLGEPLLQNDAGEKRICVYDRDRDKTMRMGARYHQTHEGGTLHTDNVNSPLVWEYMVLACVAPSLVGGESILIHGQYLHNYLQEFCPEVLEILKKPFVWECRGIADATYMAPIITYDQNGEVLFRYLRPYMESAHQKTGTLLSREQIYALDTLDALCESSHFQMRFDFKQGETLLLFDAKVLHGRTSFSDPIGAISIDEYTSSTSATTIESFNRPLAPLKRTMDRLWIKKKNT